MKVLMNMWLEKLRDTHDMVVLYGQRHRNILLPVIRG